MKKLTTLALSLVLAVAAWAASEKPTVKIGVILPLSGNNSYTGEATRSAVRFFEQELSNASHKNQYQFIFEDDQLTPRLTAQAVNKLINIDKVSAVLTLSAGPGHVVAPIAQSKGVLHFAHTNDPKVAVGDYNFINYTPVAQQAKTTADMLQAAGSAKIALVAVRQHGIIALVEALKPYLAQNGVTLHEGYFNPGERDFRVLLGKLKEKKPDTLYVMAFPPECQIILNQQQQLGMSELFTTTTVIFDYLEDKSPVEGLFYVSGAAASKEFTDKYIAFAGHSPMFTEPFIYDSIDLLVKAFEAAEKPTSAQALSHLKTLKEYTGSVGPIQISPEGVLDTPASVYRITDGRPHKVELQEVNRIPDKINAKGLGSLTKDEKETLDKAKDIPGK